MSTTLHYAPRSRSMTILWLMEELGIPYEIDSFSLASGRHKKEDFLRKNAMGKVPVVTDDGIAVSEIGAIAIYLSDKYPQAKLSPALDSPLRAAFLRWVFFSSGIMEPAFGEKFFKWSVPTSSVAWGSFDDMLRTLIAGVSDSPYLLGDTFTAADLVVGSTAGFGVQFGAIPKGGAVEAYVNRLMARDAYQRTLAIEKRERERFPIPQS